MTDGLNTSQTGSADTVPPNRAGDSQHANGVFREFANSFWASGVERPIESLAQLTNLSPSQVETDHHQSGWMQVANIAGNAAGQLFDMGLLGLGVGRVFGAVKLARSLTAVDGLATRSLLSNGTTGLLYGGVFTPVENGESQWRRLGNATVDAGAFMTLGTVNTKVTGLMGDGWLAGAAANFGDGYAAKSAQLLAGIGDRAMVNLTSGAAAGLADVQLDAWTHGKFNATGSQYINSMASWAIGNAVMGEASRQVIGAASLGIGAAGERFSFLTSDAAREHGARSAPELDLRSMKEIAQSGDVDRVRKLVNLYYPQLKKAFPLPGEIEDPETYVKYLMDPKFPWEMEQLLGPVQGGLQYQVLDVGGDKIAKAGWLEHIWVAEDVRTGGYGSALLKHVQGQVAKKGGDITFWEWNNPDKMSTEELKEDEKGGITTQDRVGYWGKRGAFVAVVKSTGELAPYSQPGMDGQEEVPYLSLAWSKPGGLDGQTISKSDYLKVLLAAHGTITDVASDPTVANYTAQLDALPDQEFQFMRLDEFIKQRTEQLSADQGTPTARLFRWLGLDIDGP